MKSRYKKGIGFLFFILVGLFGLSWVVMQLWNYAVAPVLEVKMLNYTQALALLTLMRILVGGFRMGPRGHYGPGGWREKWKNLPEEKRQKYKEEWRKRWGNHRGGNPSGLSPEATDEKKSD